MQNGGIAVVLGAVLALLGGEAYGVQLDAEIRGDDLLLEPSFKFLRIVYVDNLEGGRLAGLVSEQSVSFSADSTKTDLDGLIIQLNEGIAASGSSASVIDVRLDYRAKILPQKDSVTIEYAIEILPTIEGHILLEGTSVLLDSKWRGFHIEGPVVLDTAKYGPFDINSPGSAIRAVLPQLYSEIGAADALSVPLLDASGTLELPLSRWHYLFDPTAKQASAEDYGYEGKLTSKYSLVSCDIFQPACANNISADIITLDKEYTIRTVNPLDNAVLSIEGYTTVSRNAEIIRVTAESPDVRDVGYGFQTSVIYGMAIIGAIGTVVFLWFSHRKIKGGTDGGQTGIDPALLLVRESSSSAGGYRTNRGESFLASELPHLPPESRAPV